MDMKQIIHQAKSGRPDLAAFNAGTQGRYALALYCAKFPHSNGERLTNLRAVRLAALGEEASEKS